MAYLSLTCSKKDDKMNWWEGKKILGIDEVGRGSLAGPLVVASCIFTEKIPEEILNKIKDSKKLSIKKREEMFEYLKEHTYHKLEIINSDKVDALGISGAVRLAVNKLYTKAIGKFDISIFDGDWDPVNQDDFFVFSKADDKVKEVSAASIVAKVARDRIMTEHYSIEYPEYLFEKHKGYGTKEHRDLIKEHGRCKIHRKSFKIKGYD